MSSLPCPLCGAELTPAALQEGHCGACRGELPSGIQAESGPRPSPIQVVADPVQRASPPPGREPDAILPSIRKGGDWSGVHAGLGLLVVGLILYVACQVIEVLPHLMAVPRDFQETVGSLTALTALAKVAAAIILLVGLVRTVLPPWESGLRLLGISSLVCSLVAVTILLGVVVLLLLEDRFPESATLLPALILSGVLIFDGSLLFFLYLRGLACYFGNRSLGDAFIVYFLGSIVVMVGLVGFLFVVPPGVLDLQGRMFMLLVFGLVLMFWVISLYNQLRTLVGKGTETLVPSRVPAAERPNTSPTRCPHCAALLTPAAVQEGRCGACRGELVSVPSPDSYSATSPHQP
jgi:hypothetical protein